MEAFADGSFGARFFWGETLCSLIEGVDNGPHPRTFTVPKNGRIAQG